MKGGVFLFLIVGILVAAIGGIIAFDPMNTIISLSVQVLIGLAALGLGIGTIIYQSRSSWE